MKNSKKSGDETSTQTTAKAWLIRGLVAVGISAIVATMIATGTARPWPNLAAAYFIATAVAVWGLVDIVRGLAGRSRG